MVRKESNRLIMKRPNHRNTHLAQFCALRSGTASAFLIFLINANFLFSAKSVFKTVQIVNLKKKPNNLSVSPKLGTVLLLCLSDCYLCSVPEAE